MDHIREKHGAGYRRWTQIIEWLETYHTEALAKIRADRGYGVTVDILKRHFAMCERR